MKNAIERHKEYRLRRKRDRVLFHKSMSLLEWASKYHLPVKKHMNLAYNLFILERLEAEEIEILRIFNRNRD